MYGDVPAPRGADVKLSLPDPRVCVCPVGAGTVPSGLSGVPASVSDPSFQVGSLEPPSRQQKLQESFLKDERVFVVQKWFAGQGDRVSEINCGGVGAEFLKAQSTKSRPLRRLAVQEAKPQVYVIHLWIT